MNKHQLDNAMVRAGIDLDKLHLLSASERHQLTLLIIENEAVINAATQMTRQQMTTPILRRNQ